ncbi:MAG: SGNH/GDSL hydrolase family protein [Bacteroidota bacterium]
MGDSYTIGESVSEEERFPIQLEQQLRAEDFEWEETRIIAQTGWTTGRLLQELDQLSLATDYDLVTLLIGVNNQFTNRTIEEYEAELQELIDLAITYANGERDRVVLISIPDYAFTPFGQIFGEPIETTAAIELFNQRKLNIATEQGVEWVGITDISRRGLDQPALVATDGLHPSGAMYALWVERLVPIANAILK